jgi:metallo-beta-lactamase class B
MKRHLAILFCAVLLTALLTMNVHAQGPDAAHVAAAKGASTKTGSTQPWQDLSYVFDRECRPAGGGRGGRGAQGAEAVGKNVPLEPGEQRKLVETPREEWYVKPAKVFDNLYYIGTKTESTWALTTSAGIILLNTNFEWVTPHLLDQMKDVGLDPANIKYALITHAHSDQYWGVNELKKRVPSARIVMSEADWNTTANDNSPDRLRPKKDMVATDGTKVTLGDTTVTIYLTPGPSAGTTSLIFPVKEGNQTHMAALWGGTGSNLIRSGVRNFPDAKTMLNTQIAAMKHFMDAQKAANVDTLITVHAALDKTFEKIAAKKPGANPFVDKALPERFNTILYECAQAKLARLGS